MNILKETCFGVCLGLLEKAVGLNGSPSHRLHCTVSMPASWGGVSGVPQLMLRDASCIQVCSHAHTHLGLYKTTSNNKQAKEVILA